MLLVDHGQKAVVRLFGTAQLLKAGDRVEWSLVLFWESQSMTSAMSNNNRFSIIAATVAQRPQQRQRCLIIATHHDDLEWEEIACADFEVVFLFLVILLLWC
jgi:hypothetical protein